MDFLYLVESTLHSATSCLQLTDILKWLPQPAELRDALMFKPEWMSGPSFGLDSSFFFINLMHQK